MRLEQRHGAAPELRAILDIVVNKERVVEELERRGGHPRLLGPAAGRTACGQADAGPKSFAFAKWIISEQVVERSVSGLPVMREQTLQFISSFASRLAQHTRHQRLIVRHSD